MIIQIRELLSELKDFNRSNRKSKSLPGPQANSRNKRPKKNRNGRLLPPLLKTLRFLISDERKIPTKNVLKIKRPIDRIQR